MSQSVTASVGEPTPFPPCEPTYVVRYYDIEGENWIDEYCGVWKDRAEEFHSKHPGSVLITLPGSPPPSSPAPASGEGGPYRECKYGGDPAIEFAEGGSVCHYVVLGYDDNTKNKQMVMIWTERLNAGSVSL